MKRQLLPVKIEGRASKKTKATTPPPPPPNNNNNNNNKTPNPNISHKKGKIIPAGRLRGPS